MIRCLCLAGPTASGKSALALALAERLGARGVPVEIVSVDSALVYRGMDIGTAKPGATERALVPHHLIDLIDPAERYSAARFVADATRAVAAIAARGALPLLVGGTMLYFKALFEGLDELPASDPAVRAALAAQAREQGPESLYAELRRVDPATAARLAPGDHQRIERALEVWRTSGVAMSAQLGRGRAAAIAACDAPLIALEPARRAWLHERIETRFRRMLAEGLVGEVRALRDRGDLTPELPSMRCVGYRQTWEALADPARMADLAERGIAATRQLARRQLTWLRAMPARHTLECDAADAAQRVAALAASLLGGRGRGAASLTQPPSPA